MEARFDIRLEDLKAAIQYADKHPTGSFRVGVVLLVAFAFVQYAVVPTALLLYIQPSHEVWLLIGLVILVQIVCWVGFRIIWRKVVSKPAMRMEHQKDVTLTIGPDWISYCNPLEEHAHRWTEIEKIAVTDHHAFFFFGPRGTYVLPRRAFADADAFFNFVDTAQRYYEGAKVFKHNPYEDVT
jgi:hypothetical protein